MSINLEVKIVAPALEAVLLSIAETLENGQAVFNVKKENWDNKKDVIMEKELTLEEVRAVLVEKSKKVKKSEIKALIRKFGGEKLTDISKERYQELIKEVEGM